ncbi:MAG: chromate transporter, partial [Lachnospiraceae bacterium]|nr:chromate transporter [Lachnospiraceae bacterium]
MKVKKFISMIGTMIKIGFIGFGGGSALIPVIEDEVVEKDKIITEEEFNDDVMIASITPGALPVEIASGIGKQTAGTRGMIAAATAMALPGALLTVLLQAVITSAGDMVKTQINYLSMGISAFIMLTLFLYAVGTIQQGKSKTESCAYAFIILAVFLLSGEKGIYELFHLDMAPIFSLSIIQVLGAAFFVILFTKGYIRCLKRSVPAGIIALCYFLCAGKAHIIPLKFKPGILLVMVILSVTGLMQSVMESKHRKKFPVKRLAKSFAFWIGFVCILSLPAMFLTIKTLRLVGMGWLSSVMSFGGGDAYLSVAQGLFVEGNMISKMDFYGNVVSVANALPGSILCKILTGIAYDLGYNLNHSITDGFLVALSGFACSVAASGAIFELVFCVYEKYENLRIFAVVKHFIRPIISGLLLTVAISLYTSGIRGLVQPGWPNKSAFL